MLIVKNVESGSVGEELGIEKGDKLLSFDMIIPAPDGPSVPVTLSAKDAQFDNFIPTCNEYNDVQELLFADPIHEVKEDEGWKPER